MSTVVLFCVSNSKEGVENFGRFSTKTLLQNSKITVRHKATMPIRGPRKVFNLNPIGSSILFDTYVGDVFSTPMKINFLLKKSVNSYKLKGVESTHQTFELLCPIF